MQKSYKRIIENIISLGVINGVNLFIPLITLPYLISRVGLTNYGAYSIVYAMLQYGILFSSYGFLYSTTQQIAQNRDNIEVISIIVHATLAARLIIMIVTCIVMISICILFFQKEYLEMFLLGLGVIIGDVINPTWLYQGMEKMRFMTIVNLTSKILFTLLIFVFIKKQSDYPYITLLNSIGFMVAGVLSLLIAYGEFKIIPKIPKANHIIRQFKEGWYIFLSTLSMNLYRNSNIFILSFFLPASQIGIYSGAEKIIKGFQAIVSPISNALFPYVAKKFSTISVAQKWSSIKKMSSILLLFLLILSVVLYFYAPMLNRVLLKGLDNTAILLMRLMIPVLIFGGLNYILGIVGLVNAGERKRFFHCVMISGAISIAVLFLLIKPFGIMSAAWSMSASEIVLFIMCFCIWIAIVRRREIAKKNFEK